MKTAAIICEYNPFHDGHRHQIAETRRLLGENAAILCLMSGNYVQRGEPAIYDKWHRAEAAVKGGTDLVLELPITAAVGSAGYFAGGAVKCLHRLGSIDHLCFGSECGDISRLERLAEATASEAYQAALRLALQEGTSYARASTEAAAALGAEAELMKAPNNALGLEYLRSLAALGSGIAPMTIPRSPDFHSASECREASFAEGKFDAVPHCLAYGERAMLAVLRRLPEENFRSMAMDAEGLWSKVMKACRSESSLQDILTACKSRRFTMSRLKRCLLCLYLGIDAEAFLLEPPYLRVLAFNDRGRALLRSLSDTSALPLVSGAMPSDAASQRYFALESAATDLYGLFALPGTQEDYERERSMHPVYVRQRYGK